jgi:hypothetical protein
VGPEGVAQVAVEAALVVGVADLVEEVRAVEVLEAVRAAPEAVVGEAVPDLAGAVEAELAAWVVAEDRSPGNG